MPEVGAEFEDPNATGTLHKQPHLICTFQGNKDTINMVIELLSTGLPLIKCHERKCQWMDKSKTQKEPVN